jgi:serine/threonine protein kinase
MRFFSFLSSFWASWRDYPSEKNTVLGNRYTVHEMIGEGSYGITYKCLDQTNGSLVAVKQSRPSKGSYAKHLLQREARILKALRHSHIPSFKDLFTEGRNTYLVMSFISGDTLEDMIFDQGRQYGEQDCVRITLQLLELVGYIHKKGFVHLDLRIPNVLFKDDELYLIDFGLAREMGEPPPFMNPAQNKFKIGSVSSGQFKDSEEKADLLDIGHFMLFLLYSAYKPNKKHKDAVKLCWQDELELSRELKEMIERLLELRESYSASAQFTADLRALAHLQR